MEAQIIQISREALTLSVILSGPPLLASLVLGLLVAVFQATTQLQDSTLSFVPKLVGVTISLILFVPWGSTQLIAFTRHLILLISQVHG